MKTARIRLNYLVSLKERDPQALFNQLLSLGISKYTIKTHLEVFKGYEKFSFNSEKTSLFLSQNRFVFKNCYQEKQNSLTLETFQLLLKHAKSINVDLYNFCVLAGMHGLRAQEALSVNWSDIENGDLKVCGKGDKVRFVPLLQGFLVPSTPEDQGKIVKTLPRNFRAILSQFGCTPHDLRAFFATSISEALSPFEIAELLGHSDIKTTMRYVRKNKVLMRRKLNDYARIYQSQ